MSMGVFFGPCWRYWYRPCSHILLILTFVLNLQPVTHIQKHFNDSICIVDTSILFMTMTIVTVILLKLWFIVVQLMMIDSIELYAHWCYRLCYSFEITWIVDAYDDAMITWQFRLCIFRIVYLYTRFNLFLCSQLDPLVCGFTPSDTSHIFRINWKIFKIHEDNLASTWNTLNDMDTQYSTRYHIWFGQIFSLFFILYHIQFHPSQSLMFDIFIHNININKYIILNINIHIILQQTLSCTAYFHVFYAASTSSYPYYK